MRSERGHQQLVAGVLLVLGVVGGIALLAGALTGPTGSGVGTVGVADFDEAAVVLPTDRTVGPIEGPSTLVLYDPPLEAGNNLEFDPELNGVFMANLAGHFGPVETTLVDDYVAGSGAQFDGVVYVGASGDNVLPAAFLQDVAAGSFDVLWLGSGAEQLADAGIDMAELFGWTPVFDEYAQPSSVTYRGQTLPRDARSLGAHIIEVVDPSLASVIATAAEEDGTERPYVVRSRNLTYLTETPFGFHKEGNQSLVVADLLFDLLDPQRPTRHRALVRLEDVGPSADPDALRVLGELLAERGIPFSIGVYPIWHDPAGVYEVGNRVVLAQRPELVETLEYLEGLGATLVMHGVTHQQGEAPNPYSGVSGEDFEFSLIDFDDEGRFLYEALPDDNVATVRERIRSGFVEFARAGLTPPTLFEFPHYLGSPASYEAVGAVFDARYEQVAYFPGTLSGDPQAIQPRNQFFPYPVHDVRGEDIVPENLGNVVVRDLQGRPDRMPAEVIDAAEHLTVVRDGVASFYFHPYLDPALLVEILDGIEALGYTFVSPESVMESWR